MYVTCLGFGMEWREIQVPVRILRCKRDAQAAVSVPAAHLHVEWEVG